MQGKEKNVTAKAIVWITFGCALLKIAGDLESNMLINMAAFLLGTYCFGKLITPFCILLVVNAYVYVATSNILPGHLPQLLRAQKEASGFGAFSLFPVFCMAKPYDEEPAKGKAPETSTGIFKLIQARKSTPSLNTGRSRTSCSWWKPAVTSEPGPSVTSEPETDSNSEPEPAINYEYSSDSSEESMYIEDSYYGQMGVPKSSSDSEGSCPSVYVRRSAEKAEAAARKQEEAKKRPVKPFSCYGIDMELKDMSTVDELIKNLMLGNQEPETKDEKGNHNGPPQSRKETESSASSSTAPSPKEETVYVDRNTPWLPEWKQNPKVYQREPVPSDYAELLDYFAYGDDKRREIWNTNMEKYRKKKDADKESVEK